MLGFPTVCCMWHWHPRSYNNLIYSVAYNYVHIFYPIPAASITWPDLIKIRPWLNNQSISGFIALKPDTTCDNFANLLLQNPSVVQNLRSQNSTNQAFVTAVLTQWYQAIGTPVPFTWRDMIQCMKDAGLDPRTVHIIEQNVL